MSKAFIMPLLCIFASHMVHVYLNLVFRTCPYIINFSSHLLSGSVLNHLMHSKDAKCIPMLLSAMPRSVSVAHIYLLKLPLHHL